VLPQANKTARQGGDRVRALVAVPQNLTHAAGLPRVPGPAARGRASISLTSVMPTSLSTTAPPEPGARGHLPRVRPRHRYGLRILPLATRRSGYRRASPRRQNDLSVWRQRPRQPSGQRSRAADTRAAMTAESTPVCDQQTAEGAAQRSRECSVWGARLTDGRCPPESWRTTMRSRRRPARTLPAASQMRAAPNPRTLTGWSGASPHVLRFRRRAFLRLPVCPPGSSPFARLPLVSLRPAFSGSVPSAVARFRFPFGFPPGSLSLEQCSR